jgi:hypothetical protein
MASPAIVGSPVETAVSTASTTHTVSLPSGTTGNLLLAVMSKGSQGTTPSVDALAGWNELLDEAIVLGLYIAWRTADGTEGATTNFTLSSATRGAWVVYEISGHENPATQAPQIGTTATGTSVNPNPPSVSVTGGSKDILAFALFGMAGEQADDDTLVTTFPTNYTDGQAEKTCGVAGTNLGGMIGVAARQVTTSAEDPGTFTAIDNAAWRAQTIVVHPSSAVNYTGTVPGAAAATAAGPTPAVTVSNQEDPPAASGTAAAGLTKVNIEIGPLAAAASASGPSMSVGISAEPNAAAGQASGPTPALQISSTVTGVVAAAAASGPTPIPQLALSPAAAVALAEGSDFTADFVFEPDAAVATASGPTPSLTITGNVNVSPAAAAATAAGPTPAVSVSEEVTGVAAVATASGPTPTVTTSANITIEPAAAVATGSGPTPNVLAGVSVLPDEADAAASGPTPALTVTSTVSPAAAAAAAEAPVPAKVLTVSPGAAEASASAPAPALIYSAGVTAPAASAFATGPTPAPVTFSVEAVQPIAGRLGHTRIGRIYRPRPRAGRIAQTEEGSVT